MSVGNIANIAKQENYTSILIFHNHPNTNPNYYNFPQILDNELSFLDERECGIEKISQFKGESKHAEEEIQCII